MRNPVQVQDDEQDEDKDEDKEEEYQGLAGTGLRDT